MAKKRKNITKTKIKCAQWGGHWQEQTNDKTLLVHEK